MTSATSATSATLQALPALFAACTVSPSKVTETCIKIIHDLHLPKPGAFKAELYSDDFAPCIKTLRFPGAQKQVAPIAKNLVEIGLKEGFAVKMGALFYYPRDNARWIKTAQGSKLIYRNALIKSIDTASERAFAKSMYFSQCARALSSHSQFQSSPGGSHNESSQELANHFVQSLEAKTSSLLEQQLALKIFPAVIAQKPRERSSFDEIKDFYINNPDELKRPQFPFYFEGGNLFVLTNKVGCKKVLIGEELFTMIHAQLRLEKGLKAAEKKDLSDEELRQGAEEMSAMGLIDNAAGMLTLKKVHQLYNQDVVINFRKEALRIGLIKPFKLDDTNKDSARPIVAKYLAQKEEVLALIGDQLGEISPSDIHIIPQVEYHLDIFLFPGPNNSIFIQDFELCVQLLKSMDEKAKELSLTDKDKQILKEYFSALPKLNEQLKPLFAKARTELEKAGFNVISAPGQFYDASFHPSQKGESNASFLNSISGWSKKNQRPYLISNGAKIGDNLGNVLMELFKNFLKHFQSDLEVYFAGYDPDNPADFTPSRILSNGPMAWDAGLHCLTLTEEVFDEE